MSTKLDRLTELAKEEPKRQFFSIAHLITPEALYAAFGILCCHLRFDIPGRTRRVLLEEPAAGNLHGGVCEGGDPGGAMVDLNGHEAGNGGHSQGKPTAYRDSSTRREAMFRHNERGAFNEDK